MKYGLIGERLPHSFSREVHAFIGGYDYELRELARDEFDAFMQARDFCAINVTIPYKQDVIPYLDFIDERARDIGAVNTIVNRDGKLYGYNTDYCGLRAMAKGCEGAIRGGTVLILGTGGTSRTAMRAALDMGAREVKKVSRNPDENSISYEQAKKAYAHADVIINTTPCGMLPDVLAESIDLSPFKNLSAVIDVIYNPLRTQLVLNARERGIVAVGGLYMLISQAVGAYELFFGKKAEDGLEDVICDTITAQKENIVLIGMPSCGKTSVGRVLAERLEREFIDLDVLFEERTGISPAQYIGEKGEKDFRDEESETVRSCAAIQGAVISCGGGTVLRGENVRALRANGRIFYLFRPLDKLCPTDDRPLSSDREKLTRLYNERKDVYERACDVLIDGSGTVDEAANNILSVITK